MGLDKAISTAETVRNVKELLQRVDLHLVRDLARIDHGRMNIPVYVCRAGKDCNTPSPRTMGKGPTPEQSEASALMELVERFSHANYPQPGSCQWGTLGDVGGNAVPLDELFRFPNLGEIVSEEHRQEFAMLPFAWVPAYSLVHQKDFLVPHEWLADIQGTNGLSAGNTLEETVLQGLCEVVERHVCGAANMARKPAPTIDLATVRDPVARVLIGKFSRMALRWRARISA